MRFFLIWYKIKIYFHSLTCGHWVFLTLLVEETVFSFILTWHPINAWIYFWDLYCVSFVQMSIFMQTTCPFNYCNIVVSIKVRMWYLSLFFFVRFFGGAQGLLWVHRTIVGSSYFSEKNIIGVLIEITLNLRALCIICTFNNSKTYTLRVLLYVCIFLNSFVSA